MSGISVGQWSDGQPGQHGEYKASGRASGFEMMLSWRGSGWRQRMEKKETGLSGLSWLVKENKVEEWSRVAAGLLF